LYQGAHKQFSYLTGLLELPRESIEEYKKNILKRSHFCSLESIKYLHVVFPSKPVIFEASLQEVNILVKSLFSQEHKHQNVIYPVEKLRFDGSYYKNDTHCSPKGSWACALEILKNLDLKSFEHPIFNKQVRVSGDLAVMLGNKELTEEIEQFSG